MATAKKKTSPAKKKAAKKPSPAKKAVKAKAPKAAKAEKSVDTDLSALDRKSLAARARQLKMELMAIRFNVTSPSLQDYRKKRKALAQVLTTLG